MHKETRPFVLSGHRRTNRLRILLVPGHETISTPESVSTIAYRVMNICVQTVSDSIQLLLIQMPAPIQCRQRRHQSECRCITVYTRSYCPDFSWIAYRSDTESSSGVLSVSNS